VFFLIPCRPNPQLQTRWPNQLLYFVRPRLDPTMIVSRRQYGRCHLFRSQMLRPSAHHSSTINPLSLLLHFMKSLWLVLFSSITLYGDNFIFTDTAAQSCLTFLLRIRRISRQSPRIPITASKGDKIHVISLKMIKRDIQIPSIPRRRFSLRCIRLHSPEVLISERPYPGFCHYRYL
jgi:hypothetical protein